MLLIMIWRKSSVHLIWILSMDETLCTCGLPKENPLIFQTWGSSWRLLEPSLFSLQYLWHLSWETCCLIHPSAWWRGSWWDTLATRQSRNSSCSMNLHMCLVLWSPFLLSCNCLETHNARVHSLNNYIKKWSIILIIYPNLLNPNNDRIKAGPFVNFNLMSHQSMENFV